MAVMGGREEAKTAARAVAAQAETARAAAAATAVQAEAAWARRAARVRVETAVAVAARVAVEMEAAAMRPEVVAVAARWVVCCGVEGQARQYLQTVAQSLVWTFMHFLTLKVVSTFF